MDEKRKKEDEIVDAKFERTKRFVECLWGSGTAKKAKNVLKEGDIDVNYQDEEFKYTPLQWACISVNLELIKQLIKLGADVNTRDLHGYTPLMNALEGYQNYLAMLREKYPRTSDSKLRKKTQIAVFKAVKTLIEAGADANIKNKYGKRAIDYAIEYDNIFRYLQKLDKCKKKMRRR